MDPIIVDQDKCIHCGACAGECPASIIAMDSDDVPRPVVNFRDYCIKCGHCVAVCPTDALSLDWMTPEQCRPILPERTISPEQAEQFLGSRRSIRKFKDKKVDRAILEKLQEVAGGAPSAKNKQPWNWLVIEDTVYLRKCAGMVIDFMRSVLVANRKAAEESGMHLVVASWDAGMERVCRGAPHLILAHGDKTWPFCPEDCTLALSHLDLYATSLGLGACWGGYFYSAVNMYPPLMQELGLPKGHKAFGAMMVGHPVYSYHRMPMRNSPRVTWK